MDEGPGMRYWLIYTGDMNEKLERQHTHRSLSKSTVQTGKGESIKSFTFCA